MKRFNKSYVRALCAVIFTAAICSCATVKKSDSSARLSNCPANYSIRLASLSVTDGFSRDEKTAAQLAGMVETAFYNLDAEKLKVKRKDGRTAADFDETVLNLNVSVAQRPFFKNMTERNSIYVSAVYTDADEAAVARFGLYLETKGNVVSSVEQKKIADTLYRHAARFVSRALSEDAAQSVPENAAQNVSENVARAKVRADVHAEAYTEARVEAHTK